MLTDEDYKYFSKEILTALNEAENEFGRVYAFGQFWRDDHILEYRASARVIGDKGDFYTPPYYELENIQIQAECYDENDEKVEIDLTKLI